MTCKQIGDWLAMYALGELDRNKEFAVTEHLDECEACRAKVEAITREVGALRTVLATDMVAPPALMQRVQAEIASVRRPQPLNFGRWLFAPTLVLAALLAFLLWPRSSNFHHHDSDLDAVLADPSLFAHSESGDASEVIGVSMLSKTLGFKVTSPGLVKLGAAFTGCTTCDSATGKIARLTYQRGNDQLVVLEEPDSRAKLSESEIILTELGDLYCCSHAGTTVLGWHEQGNVVMLAARMPRDEVVKIANALRSKA